MSRSLRELTASDKLEQLRARMIFNGQRQSGDSNGTVSTSSSGNSNIDYPKMVADLESELRNLSQSSQQSLAEKNTKVEQLQRKNEELSRSVAALRERVNGHDAAMRSTQSLDRSIGSIASFSSFFAGGSAVVELENKLAALEREKQEEIEALQAKLKGREDAISQMEQLVALQDDNVEKIRAENDELLEKIAKADAEMGRIAEERSRTKETISQQNRRLKENSITIANMVRTVRSQNETLTALRTELNEAKAKSNASDEGSVDDGHESDHSDQSEDEIESDTNSLISDN